MNGEQPMEVTTERPEQIPADEWLDGFVGAVEDIHDTTVEDAIIIDT
jgi:hypothetical protein